MAVINDPNVAANIAGVGEVAGVGLHSTIRPASADGHYTVSHRMVLVNTQAANSRLFEIRNPTAGKLMVLTRLRTLWISTNAHTAFIEDSLDSYSLMNATFTTSSTTNTVALVANVKRQSMAVDTMLCKGATVAGVAAGMTGGNGTKVSPFGQHPRILPTAVQAATETTPRVADVFDHAEVSIDIGSPFVFAQNEGFLIENRVVLGAAAGSSVYILAEYFVCDAF